MKKFAALLIVLSMITTFLFAVPAVAAEDDITGVWYVQSMRQGDVEIGADILAGMGMSATLVLNEDGTASLALSSAGEAQEGTWTFDGTSGVLDIGSAPTFTIEDGIMTLGMDGNVMVLSQEPPAAEPFELNPAVEDPQIEDFDGTWKATSYVYYGLPLPLEMMATRLSITIENGTVAYKEEILDMNANFEVTDTLEYEFQGELQEDGTVFFSFEEQPVLTKVGPGADALILSLREDGQMTGVIPAVLEEIKMFMDMLQGSGEDGESSVESSGDSAGSSGDSASVEAGMEIFLLFEKE